MTIETLSSKPNTIYLLRLCHEFGVRAQRLAVATGEFEQRFLDREQGRCRVVQRLFGNFFENLQLDLFDTLADRRHQLAAGPCQIDAARAPVADRKSTRLNSSP